MVILPQSPFLQDHLRNSVLMMLYLSGLQRVRLVYFFWFKLHNPSWLLWRFLSLYLQRTAICISSWFTWSHLSPINSGIIAAFHKNWRKSTLHQWHCPCCWLELSLIFSFLPSRFASHMRNSLLEFEQTPVFVLLHECIIQCEGTQVLGIHSRDQAVSWFQK